MMTPIKVTLVENLLEIKVVEATKRMFRLIGPARINSDALEMDSMWTKTATK